MAGNTWEKRQREKAKRERNQAKRARRDEKRETKGETEAPDHEELMGRFAALNQARQEGRIDEASFLQQRDDIYEAMGIAMD